MAKDTPLSFHNLVIYEVYVRNHGPNGTFSDVEADLPRIRSMGVDVIWFMPIHPIGQLNKKGSLGCPYSISDFRGINSEYGSKADFIHLIEKAHSLGLKVMIDVVYNHTSHDSILVKEHPEWFHQDAGGGPITTVPAWADVIDLKHPQPELTAYLIETLKGWARIGVDGFRCDVASIIPLDFWLQARHEVALMKPGLIWLAESVHASFLASRRAEGLPAFSDCEVFTAFDLAYDYDIWPVWQTAVIGRVPLSHYVDIIQFQDSIYPANYVKMRCVENHDQARIMRLAPSHSQALAWTAFQAFNKGAFLIYAGQEAAAHHTPSLFDIDKIFWGDYALQPFLTRLANLKKHELLTFGQFSLLSCEPILQAAWFSQGKGLYGVFNTGMSSGMIDVQLPDGSYTNLMDDQVIRVLNQQMPAPTSAAILAYQAASAATPMTSDFFHFELPPE